MNLYSDFSGAYDSLFSRYVKSKNEQLFYMFIAKIGRREFLTVLSAVEAEKYRIDIKNFKMVVGETEEQKRYRREYQETIHSDKGQEDRLYQSYFGAAKKAHRMRKEIDKRLESENI